MVNKNASFDHFYLVNEKGEEIECACLFSFFDTEMSSEYCVYTDSTVNENNEWNVYVAKMSDEDGVICFSDIEDEEKLNEIDLFVKEVFDAINDDTVDEVLKKYGYYDIEGGDDDEKGIEFDGEN